jgi:hypothetical protein
MFEPLSTSSGDWTGPFTWDGLSLRMHIATVKKD